MCIVMLLRHCHTCYVTTLSIYVELNLVLVIKFQNNNLPPPFTELQTISINSQIVFVSEPYKNVSLPHELFICLICE